MVLDDTIAALATPAGEAAIALIRVSGPQSAALVRSVFTAEARDRRVVHAPYLARGGQEIDTVLYWFLRGPRSYTGEDTLEISCHGNPLVAAKILQDLHGRGCRPAEPGEFTQRAFLRGRLDLSQAEAVMDLIRARSDRALEAANRQLRGALGQRVAGLADKLLQIVAGMEAYLDFPEEDLPPQDIEAARGAIEEVAREVDRLLATGPYGALLRDGIAALLIGAPNAGKSSLLNRLVGYDRALVSPEPGTTRDFLEERCLLGGHCIRFLDTAGLNPHPGELERLGIAKTLERAEEADLFLLVLDASQPPPPLPQRLRELLDPDRTVVVVNKVDLAPGSSPPDWASFPLVRTSAVQENGVEPLVEAIARWADKQGNGTAEAGVAINARHAYDLTETRSRLQHALSGLSDSAPMELIASELRGALDSLGRIGGKIDHEGMLDKLFATFCIGK